MNTLEHLKVHVTAVTDTEDLKDLKVGEGQSPLAGLLQEPPTTKNLNRTGNVAERLRMQHGAELRFVGQRK